MKQINQSIRSSRGPEIEHKDVEPHDIFDLVAGTSTGGLIAIMLGKLGMTVEQCIEAYYGLSATIFGRKHLRARVTRGLGPPAKYSGSRMRNCVRQLIYEHRSNRDLPMSADENRDRIAW
jgi:Patatin-like phospholipase